MPPAPRATTPTRRSLLGRCALLSATVLVVGSTAACGGDPEPVFSGTEGFDAVTVSGPVGTEPELTWKDQMSADGIEAKTLVEGDGPPVATGEQALVQYVVGNGFSRSVTYDSYDPKAPGAVVTIGEEVAQPGRLGDLVANLLAKGGVTQTTVGSRVAVVADAEEEFGDVGVPELGIGNRDAFLLVVDVVDAVLARPDGTRRPAPPWAPRLVTTKGELTGLDFAGTPEPVDRLRTAVLVQGTGDPVRDGDTLVADYLGQVYGSRKPFDESYSREPTAFPIGVGGVIKGWDQALVGVPAGSRVLLAVPPRLGYGKQGNPQIDVGGDDTLYFVVDVLAAG